MGGMIALDINAHWPDMVHSLIIADSFARPRAGAEDRIYATQEAVAYLSMKEFGNQYAGDRLIDALVWLLLSLIGLPVGLAGLRLIPMSVLTLGVAHSSAAEVASGVDACEPPPSPLFARELAAGPYFGGD